MHSRTALPTSQKENIIKNELEGIKERCSTQTQKEEQINRFQKELTERGYQPDIIKKLQNSNHQYPVRDDIRPNNKHYFWFPFINDKFDKKIKNTIKRSGFQIGLYRRKTKM